MEQDLYHAIATVASLLLRIGEVGKKFSVQPGRKPQDGDRRAGDLSAKGTKPSGGAVSEPPHGGEMPS